MLYLAISVTGFVDLLQSTRNQLKQLKIYKVVFQEPGETFDRQILSRTCTALSILSSTALGIPFITGNNNLASAILQTIFQNASSIERLILHNHVGVDDE